MFLSLSVFGEFLFLYLFLGVFLNKRACVFSLLFFGTQNSLPVTPADFHSIATLTFQSSQVRLEWDCMS